MKQKVRIDGVKVSNGGGFLSGAEGKVSNGGGFLSDAKGKVLDGGSLIPEVQQRLHGGKGMVHTSKQRVWGCKPIFQRQKASLPTWQGTLQALRRKCDRIEDLLKLSAQQPSAIANRHRLD